MRNCPYCGALINDGQTKCSLCNSPIEPSNNQSTEQNRSTYIIDSLDDNTIKKSVYEPLPENNTEQVSDDDSKKNIMSDILKEHEEKNNNKPKKDDTLKAALLSIIVVIIIVAGGYFAVKFGFDKINNGEDHIMNLVVNQANEYTSIVKNYMKKYDYKYKTTSLNGYYAKARTFNFISIPLTSKCVFKDGKWSGADEEEASCEKFFNDINSNYCTSVPCDVPSEAEIYLKETYETMEINGNEETITTGTVLDGTTLTYDDIICSLSGTYTCKYIEK